MSMGWTTSFPAFLFFPSPGAGREEDPGNEVVV